MSALAVLVFTVEEQMFDTNFYTLWEATALLQGDHPYRDFYEWGVPLQAFVSAGAQLIVGHRLIGEFLVQWLFIVAGVALSFRLAMQASRSTAASLATVLLALAVLAATPTFHYPKLFLYPLAIALAWWYLDRPNGRRAAILGVATAAAFLFRHDHGIYVGCAAALALLLASIATPAGTRRLRPTLEHGAIYTAVTAILLLPWLIVVQTNEGLPQYVRLRADLYREWSASDSPYRWLRTIAPRAAMGLRPLPAARPGTVSFYWDPAVDAATRGRLEHDHGLRLRQAEDDGRTHYDVPNVFDPTLLELAPVIGNTEGINWDVLEASRSWLPTREDARNWLCQVSMLVPLLLLFASGRDVLARHRARKPVPLAMYRMLLAGAFLAAIEARLFREPSYFVVVAPLTAALAAPLLVRPVASSTGRPLRLGIMGVATRAAAYAVFAITTIAVLGYVRNSIDIDELPRTVLPAFKKLLASPPIEGYLPSDELPRVDVSSPGDIKEIRLRVRYVHDCTRDGDRLLVTGSTPYDVPYYAGRAIAGGHLFWHHRWRSDPTHEQQLLALLETQSVPFAISTSDPVLDDLKTYPRIRDYVTKHYVEVPGVEGLLLVDRRRQPTTTFEPLHWPCFR